MASKRRTPDDTIDARSSDEKATTRPIENLVNLPVDDKEPMKTLKLRKNLSDELREMISTFLKKNLDMFTWKHFDIEGIDPMVICHCLNLDLDKMPIRQKWHTMDTKQYQVLKNKVDKLLACDFIKESFYTSWLAKNPMESGGPVLILSTSTKLAQKIASHFRKSISLCMRPRGTSCSVLWMPT